MERRALARARGVRRSGWSGAWTVGPWSRVRCVWGFLKSGASFDVFALQPPHWWVLHVGPQGESGWCLRRSAAPAPLVISRSPPSAARSSRPSPHFVPPSQRFVCAALVRRRSMLTGLPPPSLPGSDLRVPAPHSPCGRCWALPTLVVFLSCKVTFRRRWARLRLPRLGPSVAHLGESAPEAVWPSPARPPRDPHIGAIAKIQARSNKFCQAPSLRARQRFGRPPFRTHGPATRHLCKAPSRAEPAGTQGHGELGAPARGRAAGLLERAVGAFAAGRLSGPSLRQALL